jgi:hypothetical protein
MPDVAWILTERMRSWGHEPVLLTPVPLDTNRWSRRVRRIEARCRHCRSSGTLSYSSDGKVQQLTGIATASPCPADREAGHWAPPRSNGNHRRTG